MKAVGRFFGLFFLEWVLDMAICVVAMFSLDILMSVFFWVFEPNYNENNNTYRDQALEIYFYKNTNVIEFIPFVVMVNVLRSTNQIIINLLIRSIVSFFYFNIYLSIFLISTPAIVLYGTAIFHFIVYTFFTPLVDSWFLDTRTWWISASIPFVISTLTAPYVVYRWKGEVFESRLNRKFREQLAEKKRTQKHEDIPEQPWWEEGIGPKTLLDFCRKRFRKRSNE